jgi:hypothetical protein
MPPRPPPPPATLTVLCSALTGVLAFGAVRADAVLRAAAGPRLVPLAAELAGSAVVIAAGVVLYGIVALVRAPGWLRVTALAALVIAVLWLPTSLAAAAVGGAGPVGALYARLGDPPAGRWASPALGVLLLLLLAGSLTAAAVGTGRAWVRADGRDFRRRLVRVVAGWPAMVAIGVVAVHWAWTPWFAWWPVAVMTLLMVRTR